jgi:hypothetical protein
MLSFSTRGTGEFDSRDPSLRLKNGSGQDDAAGKGCD